MFISPLAHDFEPANGHNDNMKLVRHSDFFRTPVCNIFLGIKNESDADMKY